MSVKDVAVYGPVNSILIPVYSIDVELLESRGLGVIVHEVDIEDGLSSIVPIGLDISCVLWVLRRPFKVDFVKNV